MKIKFLMEKLLGAKMDAAMSNKDFLTDVYLRLLGRFPDNSGMEVYMRLLSKGVDKYKIVYLVLSSDEFFKKLFNWKKTHSDVIQLLGDEFKKIQNYPAILNCLINGNRLPAKIEDLNKFSGGGFVYLDHHVIYFERIVVGYGVLIDISTATSSTYGEFAELDFYIDGVVSKVSQYGEKILILGGINSTSILAIKRGEKKLLEKQIDELMSIEAKPRLNVAIVGRFETSTSIGALSNTFVSQLYENCNCILIDTRPADSNWNGFDENISKLKSTYAKSTDIDVAIYTDVFSNGLYDKNFNKVPNAQVKIAYVVFDSTRLPSWWVEVLNAKFDAVITTSNWGKNMIENSGVMIPVFYLPLSLNFSIFDHKKLRDKKSEKFRFGCIGSFSERKNIRQLVNCFLDCFINSDSVELVLHTPLNYGASYDEVCQIIKDRNATNVIISREELNDFNYASLMNSFDVYVLISKGECYSITPRQAFALGKPAIISAGHAHDEMIESGLFLKVPVAGYEEARFEAFSNQTIGLQTFYNDKDVCDQLRNAYFNFEKIINNSLLRKEFAFKFSNESLKYYYENIISPKALFFGGDNKIHLEGLSTSSKSLYLKYQSIKEKSSSINDGRRKFQKIVVPVHDGGFYSIFNTFLSHFVWNYGRSDVAAVIPDWRLSTLNTYRGVNNPTSFCYGNYNDGNVFIRIFNPIPGIPVAEGDYNDHEFLTSNVVYLDDFNQRNEPLLTYVNATQLYKSKDFPEWRLRYNRFYSNYFRLKDDILTQIEKVKLNHFSADCMIGVHIKHPSHAIEQSNGFMPGVNLFIKKIIDVVTDRRIYNYKIFLATDQEAVVDVMKLTFGDRVVVRDGLARTTKDNDLNYHSLSRADQMREGHQIQNLLASDPSKWSVSYAEDVIIDAHLLSSCDLFIHVTSNIATAVSYINPNVEMIYCE